MRWMTRLVVALAITLAAGWVAYGQVRALYVAAFPAESDSAAPARRGGERRPVVGVAQTVRTDFAPVTRGFARTTAPRRVAVVPRLDGWVARISPDLRDGAAVEQGDVLFVLDTRDAEGAIETARIALARSEAELGSVVRTLAGTDAIIAREEAILALRREELARMEDLRTRGSGTAQQRDTARLSVLTAEGAVETARADQEALRADRRVAELAVEEAERALAAAEHALDDYTVVAALGGTFRGTPPVVGDVISSGTDAGEIVDETVIELELALAGSEIARFQDTSGAVLASPVLLTRGSDGHSFTARLDRLSIAETEESEQQVLIARIEQDRCPCLTSGEFLSFEIAEPPLEDVAVLPATALSAASTVLRVGEDDRLVEEPVTVLRRMNDLVVIAAPDAPFAYVEKRLPQLGAGLHIRPELGRGAWAHRAALEHAG